MIYLALGLVALVVGLLLVHQLRTMNPGMMARLLRWGLIAAAIAFVVFLALTGRLAAALPLLLAAPLLFARYRKLGGLFGGGGSAGTPGQTSQVDTATLRMTLDHASGTMTGTVLRGPFTGRDLASLGEDDLVSLYAQCVREDAEAARLLEAYLDRGPHAATWRDRVADRGGAPPPGRMTREEACRILDVAPDADPEAIRDAHRRLMMANHPDRGGSTYLAAKINEAKDVLLAQGG